MKHLPYLLTALLLSIIIYQAAFQRGMMQETLHTTQSINHQLDSLWSILSIYETTRQDYQEATDLLAMTQASILQAEQDLLANSANHEKDLLSIREQLLLLTQRKLNHTTAPPASIDSLLFQP